LIGNIGCGNCGREEGEIGVDLNLGCKPTVQADCTRLPFKNESFSELHAFHILEHVPDIVSVMNECYRVLKNNGIMTIKVPEFPAVQALADPTHVRFFVPETFRYFTREGALTGLKYTFTQLNVSRKDWEMQCVLKKETGNHV
jgi:ubiquinone/menaquinone biosynthesis C-methylase UbiE